MSSENRSNGEDKLPPPNAFLAVQVQSPEIHRRLVDVAGKILDYDASLAWALEPVVKSHVTLLGLCPRQGCGTESTVIRTEYSFELG